MSACLTVADLLTATLVEVANVYGATVTYYTQILTGYDTATQERDPYENTAVSVFGFFGKKTLMAPDNTIRTIWTFAFPASDALIPMPLDRLVSSGRSYTVTDVQVQQIGAVVAGYSLTLQN